MKTFITILVLFCTFSLSAQRIEKKEGKPFPTFKAKSLDGRTFSSKQIKGKVTLINFWFEACSPCVAEFDALNDIYNRFKDNPDFEFISFTPDSERSANESVTKHRLHFAVCPLSSKECYRLNFQSGYPTSVVVDRNGMIVYFASGGKIDKELVPQDLKPMEDMIIKLLNQQTGKQ